MKGSCAWESEEGWCVNIVYTDQPVELYISHSKKKKKRMKIAVLPISISSSDGAF